MNSVDKKAPSYLESLTQVEEQSRDDEYQAFSFGRVGSRTQSMVTFIKSEGYTEAIAYAKLDRISSPALDTQLKLDFGDREVVLEGNNLETIFRYLVEGRCAEIREGTAKRAMNLPISEPNVLNLKIMS